MHNNRPSLGPFILSPLNLALSGASTRNSRHETRNDSSWGAEPTRHEATRRVSGQADGETNGLTNMGRGSGADDQ